MNSDLILWIHIHEFICIWILVWIHNLIIWIHIHEFIYIWIHMIISYVNSYSLWIHKFISYMNSDIYEFIYMNSYMNSYKLWFHVIFSYTNSYVSWIYVWIRVYQGSRCPSVIRASLLVACAKRCRLTTVTHSRNRGYSVVTGLSFDHNGSVARVPSWPGALATLWLRQLECGGPSPSPCTFSIFKVCQEPRAGLGPIATADARAHGSGLGEPGRGRDRLLNGPAGAEAEQTVSVGQLSVMDSDGLSPSRSHW